MLTLMQILAKQPQQALLQQEQPQQQEQGQGQGQEEERHVEASAVGLAAAQQQVLCLRPKENFRERLTEAVRLIRRERRCLWRSVLSVT
jgi:hypothetical protein